MSKLRSVNTHFWNDNYVIDLDPTEKLIFLYLLTNNNTNMLGIYEVHVRKIAFDTGIDKDMVLKIFDRFSEDGKATYKDGYVIMHNFLKHQNLNKNMAKSAIRNFNDLPVSVQEKAFNEGIVKALKGFGKGSEPIEEIEYEYERELEEEKESEEEPDLDEPGGFDFPNTCEFLDEADYLANYLLESIRKYDPTHKYHKNPPALNGWVLDIERAMRLDGRTQEQLEFIIDYIYRHNGKHSDFWAGNIESGKKLRKHFDKIKNQIKQEKSNGKPTTNQIKRNAISQIEKLEFEDA